MIEKVIAKVKELMNGRQIDDFTNDEFIQQISNPIMHFIKQEVDQRYPDLENHEGGPRNKEEDRIALKVRNYLNNYCNNSCIMWVTYNDWTLSLKKNI